MAGAPQVKSQRAAFRSKPREPEKVDLLNCPDLIRWRLCPDSLDLMPWAPTEAGLDPKETLFDPQRRQDRRAGVEPRVPFNPMSGTSREGTTNEDTRDNDSRCWVLPRVVSST